MVQPEPELITESMRACIGTTTPWRWIPEDVSASDVRHFVSVVGETNPIYRDAEYARRHGYDGVVVPPIFVVILFRRLQDSEGDASRFGIDWPGFTLPNHYRNNRNAGQEYHFHRPLYVGDRIRVRAQLKDVYVKTGRRQVPVMYIVSEIEVRNQHDQVVVRQVNVDAKLPNMSVGE